MIPHIPSQAPFSAEQRSWLNGYFAGLYSVQHVEASGPASATSAMAAAMPNNRSAAVSTAAPGSAGPITILYGSQTGTAEGLARKASNRLAVIGFAPEVRALDDLPSADVPEIERLLVITSTYGDGEMPDNAEMFWEDLTADDAPALDAMTFSVLALGDSSYPDFCEAGKKIDKRLEVLGARRIHDRVDCDVDVDEPFETWLNGVMGSLSREVPLARAA